MSHLIFEIDELVTLVTDYLVEISLSSAVSFALTRRSLEEPALSSLWREQTSVVKLLQVLPQFIWTDRMHRRFVSRYDVTLGHILYRFS